MLARTPVQIRLVILLTCLSCHTAISRAACDAIFTVATGTLGGSGQVDGDLTNIGGSLAPGNGVGRFTVLGTYCQLPDAEVVFEIGGTQLGIEHDFLWVNGTAELSGGFRIELVNDFIPSNGDEFTLMNLKNVEGQFDTFTLPDLGVNQWDLSSLLDTGVVRVVPEPATGVGVAFVCLAFIRRRDKSS